MIKNKEMKIYKYLTRISIASCMLFGVSIFQGCMEQCHGRDDRQK